MTIDQDIKTTGVDEFTPLHMTTESEMEPILININQYEYVNLQGTFVWYLSPATIKIILQIQSVNEQQNFRNTLDFITNEARKDQMVKSYILTLYNLQTWLKKFGESGKKEKMKELQQMLAI